MLEFKAQSQNQATGQASSDSDGSPVGVAAEISRANLLRIETSRTPAATGRSWFADFDFLRAITAFFSAAWSTDRNELQPIPVRIRDRL